jgi:hypothetical protein
MSFRLAALDQMREGAAIFITAAEGALRLKTFGKDKSRMSGFLVL